MAENPFESIDSARMYVRLLLEQVEDVTATVDADIAALVPVVSRRLDALRIVKFKLAQLQTHLQASSRTLNDLRALHRILTGDRSDAAYELADDRSAARSSSPAAVASHAVAKSGV